ncbi:MAG: acyltransferase family protein [Ilumatobacteraceae bacterium]
MSGAERQLRGDIEGLRAIAVLSVLLYHIGVGSLSGGFAGVDVFFVISGYLITSLLLKEVERTGRVSLLDFYSRRARRLLPAATVVLVVTGLAGLRVLTVDQYRNLGVDIAAAAGYVLNWVLAGRAVDYLAEDAGASPLQHFWSLSVEEQFYVVWPVLLIVIAVVARRVRWSFRTLAFVVLGVLSVASLVYSSRHTGSSPATAYFITTTRVWELGVGALLAILTPVVARLPRVWAHLSGWAGVGLIALTLVVVSTATPWPGTAAMLPVMGTALVICGGCIALDTPVARLLGVRPMRWIGGLSYSIYLWHWPLIVLAKDHWPDLSQPKVALVGLASVPLAWLTRHLVEDPVRFNRAVLAKPGRSLIIGAVGMGLSFGVAWVVVRQVPPLVEATAQQTGAIALVADPNVEGVPTMIDDPSAVFDVTGPLSPDPAVAVQDTPAFYADGCQADEFSSDIVEGCVYGAGPVEVAIVGDSKMGQWMPAIDLIGAREGWRTQLYLKSACAFTAYMTSLKGSAYESCQTFGKKVVDRLTTPGQVPDIVFISQGRSGNRGIVKVDPGFVDGTVEYWQRLIDAGATVVVLADNPWSVSGAIVGTKMPGYECMQLHRDDYSQCTYRQNRGGGTAAMEQAAERVPAASLVNINTWVCPTQLDLCPSAIGGRLVFRQGSHLTASYARSLAPILERSLKDPGITNGTMPLVAPG